MTRSTISPAEPTLPNSDKNKALDVIEWEKLNDKQLAAFAAVKERLKNLGITPDDDCVSNIDAVIDAAKKQIAINTGEGNILPTKDE